MLAFQQFQANTVDPSLIEPSASKICSRSQKGCWMLQSAPSSLCGTLQIGHSPFSTSITRSEFRIVPNIIGKDGMTSSNNTISTGQLDPIDTSLFKWLPNLGNTSMKEIGSNTAIGSFISDLLKPCYWEIANENVALAGWLASNFFGQISNGKIDGVCCFVAKEGHNCLI